MNDYKTHRNCICQPSGKVEAVEQIAGSGRQIQAGTEYLQQQKFGPKIGHRTAPQGHTRLDGKTDTGK